MDIALSFSASEIGIVTTALQGAVVNTLVRKVIAPQAGNRICMELRGPGLNHYLLVCVDNPFCAIGRIEQKPKAAEVPTAFVMLLRKMCIGCMVTRVEQLNDDRVVAITLSRKDSFLVLMCELSGRHANLFLLDESSIILGAYYPNRSSRRRLVCGEPYQMPLPPPMLKEKRDSVAVEAGIPVDMAMMALHAQQASAANDAQLRVEANRAVTALLKKQRALVANLQGDQEKAQQAEQLKHDAYILQANLHHIQKGATVFEGTDFEGNPCSFSLNPKWGPVENMQAMFNRAGRMGRASDRIEERLLEAMLEEERLAALKQDIAVVPTGELDAILGQLEKANPQVVHRAQKRSSLERMPYRQYAIFGAHTARVGRSARDNDGLTLHHSNPNDLWLHVRGIPGSHVVVPMGRGEEPSQDVLVDAAHLAAHFSSARGADHVEVTYTLRRYVQKPRGAAQGSVRLLKEKTFMLKVSESRLQEILSSQK